MEWDNIPDENLEKVLQIYYNTPFFRDNPCYLYLWERYYILNQRDPRILFFMKHKGISKNYHFLYVELSRYFELKSMKDVSASLLKKAISSNVHKREVLVKELLRLGKIPNVLTKEEIGNELKLKSLFFWNKEWIFYQKKVVYDKKEFTVDGQEISFEEARYMASRREPESTRSSLQGGFLVKKNVRNDCAINGIKIEASEIDFLTLHNNSMSKERQDFSEQHHKEEKHCTTCIQTQGNVINERFNRESCQSTSENREDVTLVIEKGSKGESEPLHQEFLSEKNITGTSDDLRSASEEFARISEGKELIIGQHVFYVKKQICQNRFFLVKVGEIGHDSQTFISTYHTLQDQSPNMNFFDKFIPKNISVFEAFMLYEYYRLGLLASVLNIIEGLVEFFFLKALEIAIYYSSKDVFFADLSAEDFFITSSFSLVVCNFSLGCRKSIWEYSVFHQLGWQEAEKHMMLSPEEAFFAISKKMKHLDLSIRFLKLKMVILERTG